MSELRAMEYTTTNAAQKRPEVPRSHLDQEEKLNAESRPYVGGFYPPKFNSQHRYLGPQRPRGLPPTDSEESVTNSSGRVASRRGNTTPEDDSSNDSYEASGAASSQSSFVQGPSETPDTGIETHNEKKNPFEDAPPPERDLVVPDISRPLAPRAPTRAARRSSDSSTPGQSGHSTQDAHQTIHQTDAVAVPTPQDSTSPREAVKAASEVQRQNVALQKRGKRNITVQKYAVGAGLVALNFMFIFSSWWWRSYWFVYFPFIALPLVLNCVMIASILCFKLKNTLLPEKMIEPGRLETLAMVMPCYNETFEECTKSLDSLVDQVGIEENKKGIIVICDGRVRGPGMEKTTAEYLLDDIFVDSAHRERIKDAYTAWDGQKMSVEVSRGSYKGVPYFCIVKDQNQGKRDSLIVVRSFLYKYNVRQTNPKTVFSRHLLSCMTNWLSHHVGADQIDHLIGMDADTVFDTDCIYQLLKESKYPNTVGVCGYVAVDFSGGHWNIWSLYQNAEYTIAQGLRRLHQSIATKKVSCLPGCCQLLRICETTCGDKVLVELFGYHPKPLDGMLKQIRATASEDRNHVCLMLTTFPKAQTRQALRARAFTDVPHSWSVFLSQRRRWTLGATSNDLLLVTARHCQWWERLLAASNVLCWCLNIFIVAAIGCMIVAFMSQPWWIILAFAGVMIVPLSYYVLIAVWLPRTLREKLQYLVGLFSFTVLGPFLNITIMLFAVMNMDSFGWGKTRLVIPDNVKEDMREKPSQTSAHLLESGSSSSMTRGGRGDRYDEEASIAVARPPAARAAPHSHLMQRAI